LLTGKSKDRNLVKRIETLHQQSEHKRNIAIQPNSFNRLKKEI
jgi:NH3-dependent NAD+ synthetase